MAKVSAQKQALYDEGVQKIQSQIDNVAGLDIIRDVDKNYLQSKLNELGGKLKTVAAGDFSNFQLVNSVSGMANQIVKDKDVQTAVGSTAWYRKQAAEMEAAIKEGKSSQANMHDFNEKANEYISSTDLGRSFNGRYTQYTDVKKKAMESIKALHPELQKYDIPFEIVNGKIVLDKKGKEAIGDAMKRHKIEGIDEGQIVGAISASLTPDDINQLGIDARYQFRGTTPEQLAQRATINYTNNKKEAISTIEYLNNQRKIVTDPSKLDTIDKRLEYYQSLVGKDGRSGKLDDQLVEDLRDAKENPDFVKSSIYKDGFIKEFANAFSWKNEEMEYVKNPLRDQLNWVEEQKLEIQKENRQRYEFGVTTGLREKEIAISEKKLLLDAEANALKKAEIYGVDSDWTTIGNETDIKLRANEMFVEHQSSVKSAIEGDTQKLLNKGYSQDDVNIMLNDYIKNGNKAKSVPSTAIGTLQNILKNNNYLKSLEDKQKELKAAAASEVEGSKEYKQSLVDANTFANSINGGNAITLQGKWDPVTKTTPTKIVTPKEMINNIATGKAKFRMDAGQIIYDDGEIHVDISRFGRDVANAPAMRKVFEQVSEYNRKGYFDIQKKATKKIDDVYKEKLAPLVQDFVPQIKSLGADKDGSPTAVTLGKVSALITATIARGVAADDVYDAETASSLLESKNSKDTRIFVQQSGDNFEIILKSESDPNKLQRIKVPKDEVVKKFGDKYVNNRTQESIRLKMGKGNTNLNKNPERSLMQQQFGDFSGIRSMQVSADLDQDLDNPDLYVPIVNVKKKDGKFQSFPLSGIDNLSRVGYEQGKANMNALTDGVLLKYLKANYPNYDYSQLDIN
jgi:hypothetical protein